MFAEIQANQASVMWALLGSVGLAGLCAAMAWRAHSRNQQLNRQLVHAEKARQHMAQYLTAMSHHLRTPLNGIVGYAEYMQTSSQEPMIQFTSKIIHENSVHMLELVNGILDLSKIETGQLALHLSEFKLHDLLTELLETHHNALDATKLKLRTQFSHQLPPVLHQDKARLKSILSSLLDNAIRFSPAHGEVVFSADLALENQQLVFSIEDQGPGVPEALRAVLFKSYIPAEGYVVRPHAGAGLGLLLAHKWVRLLGGTVGYTPRPQGGSLFYASVPVRHIQAGAQT